MTKRNQENSMDNEVESREKKNKKTGVMLALVTVMMFGFAFAMVPLYELVCDIAGINNITANSGRLTDKELTNTNAKERIITVQFDATINGNLPWEFHPKSKTLKVVPGQTMSTSYFFKNNSDKLVVTQSIPGVTPWQANQHLKKIECFCFESQTLAAGESKDMGLQFVIDPSLPEDINTITLSYTIMDTDRSDSLSPNKNNIPTVESASSTDHNRNQIHIHNHES